MSKNILTQKRLKELLVYDKDSGFFFHKNKRRGVSHKNMLAGTVAIRGCIHISVDVKLYKAHRLAYLYENGKFPDLDIDHINHNPKDNSWVNLREVTNEDNHKNIKMFSHNKSGANGVHFDKRTESWKAEIGVKGKNIFLGRYKAKSDAVESRALAEIKYGFHENHGR